MTEPYPNRLPGHPPPSGNQKPPSRPSFSHNGKRIGRPPNYLRVPLPIPENGGLGGTSLRAVLDVVNDKHWEDCKEEMGRLHDENVRLRAIIETRQYLDKSWHVPTADVANGPLLGADGA